MKSLDTGTIKKPPVEAGGQLDRNVHTTYEEDMYNNNNTEIDSFLDTRKIESQISELHSFIAHITSDLSKLSRELESVSMEIYALAHSE